jgi:quinol monooxygenase YgiN
LTLPTSQPLANYFSIRQTFRSQNPGCERFEVYQSQTDPQTFLLVEWWASEEDLETHRTNKNFVEVYKPKVLPLVERLPHPSDRLV